jgi:hypothetical protein
MDILIPKPVKKPGGVPRPPRPSFTVDAEGYKVEVIDCETDHYIPAYRVYPPGSERPYSVDTINGTCTCMGQRGKQECKHLRGMRQLLKLIPSLN